MKSSQTPYRKTVVCKQGRKVASEVVFSSIVGLDLGSSHARAVECVPDKKTGIPKITKVGEIQLPPHIMSGGEVDAVEELADILQMLWKENKFTKTRVVVGCTGENTLVREIELPWEKQELFRSSLPYRLGNELPVNPFDVELDYHPIREVLRKKALYQQALLVGALKNSVLKTEISAKLAKIIIRRVDYNPYAVMRAAQMEARLENPEKYMQKKHNKKTATIVVEDPSSGDKIVTETSNVAEDGTPVIDTSFMDDQWGQVVVNIGSHITEIVVHKEDIPLFVKTTMVGSHAITTALMEKLNIKAGAAEVLKTTLGLEESKTLEELEIAVKENNIPPKIVPPAQKIINVMAEALIQNVRETVEYYLDTTHDIEGINRVRVGGGGALLDGYTERLAGELKTPTTTLNPLALFSNKKSEEVLQYFDGPEYVTAYGLAVK